MAKLWLTYAWADNAEGDIDFVAQELTQVGITVQLDRWSLSAGRRLWEQIADFITDPAECDAWVLYATQASLRSEPCREEYAYALGRALEARGVAFPVIGLFPASIDEELITAGIKSRLYVSTRDPDWKERIKAAAEHRSVTVSHSVPEPYFLRLYTPEPEGCHVIEVRPRAGTWSPFFAAIPISERENVSLHIAHGPSGRIPMGTNLSSFVVGSTPDGQWWFNSAGTEATPTQSYYLFCRNLPSEVLFGVDGRPPQFTVRFDRSV